MFRPTPHRISDRSRRLPHRPTWSAVSGAFQMGRALRGLLRVPAVGIPVFVIVVVLLLGRRRDPGKAAAAAAATKVAAIGSRGMSISPGPVRPVRRCSLNAGLYKSN